MFVLKFGICIYLINREIDFVLLWHTCKQHLKEFASFGFHLEEGQDLEGLTGKALDKRYLAGLRFRYRGRTRL